MRPFWFSYGVSAAVDALSGMTVNLVLVDQWAAEFLSGLSEQIWPGPQAFFQAAVKALEPRASSQAARLARLELQEAEGLTWIYEPSSRQTFWQATTPLELGGQAMWLKVKAEAALSQQQILNFKNSSWKTQAELQSRLSDFVEASVTSHLAGIEFRLR
jgi:hypothetical protein